MGTVKMENVAAIWATFSLERKSIHDSFRKYYKGNGKLLSLTTKSLDSDLRGGGALLLGYGKKGVYQPGITLYLPEGRDLATQGFMMWK